MLGESKLAKMVCSVSLTPCFLNSDCVTAEIICITVHACHEVLAWAWAVCGVHMVSSTHKAGGVAAASGLCPLGQPQEERTVVWLLHQWREAVLRLLCQPGEHKRVFSSSSGRSLLPAVGLLALVSFQPLSSHLAYPGFNEQSAQRDTARQLASQPGWSAKHQTQNLINIENMS